MQKISKPCPECGASLHIDAQRCKCGWQDIRAARKAAASQRFACAAFGCPLPGTLFGSAQATEGWCFVHDAHRETLPLQGLTMAITARRSLFEGVAAVLAEVSLVDWWGELPGKYAKPFRTAGRLDLLPTATERKNTIAAWVSRVRRALEVDIMADLGVDVKSGKARPIDDEPRSYAPSDEDVAAAAAAEAAIANGTWRKIGEQVAA